MTNTHLVTRLFAAQRRKCKDATQHTVEGSCDGAASRGQVLAGAIVLFSVDGDVDIHKGITKVVLNIDVDAVGHPVLVHVGGSARCGLR